MELLVRSGRDIPEVMMMLIPEAWQNDDLMDEEKKAFYRCCSACLPACCWAFHPTHAAVRADNLLIGLV